MASVDFDTKNIVCKKHKEQKTCLYCDKCNILVCPTCISTKHKKHDFIEIKNGYIKKMAFIQRSKIKLQWSRRDANRKQEALSRLKQEETTKFKRAKENIKKHEQAWLRTISKHFEAIQNELEQFYDVLTKTIGADIEALSNYTDEIETKLAKAENFGKTGNDAIFFVKPKKMPFNCENGRSAPPLATSSYVSVPKFVSGEITPQFRVGKLISQESAVEVSLQIDKQYHTDMSTIGLVSPCTDGSIWISNTVDSLVRRVQESEQTLETLQSVETKIYGMTVGQSNDILVSVDGPIIKVINSTTGQIDYTSYNVKPFETTTIYNTCLGKVLVGGFRASQERGVVFEFDDDGNTEKVYEYDQKNQPLFRYPCSIANGQNEIIFVADNHPKDGIGRVVVIKDSSEIKNIYLGHPNVNKTTPFKPVSIVATPRSNVIVSDFDTHSFHVLDGDGHFLTFYNATELGILYPHSLGINPDGYIYVGCSRGRGCIDRAAKLFKIELLES